MHIRETVVATVCLLLTAIPGYPEVRPSCGTGVQPVVSPAGSRGHTSSRASDGIPFELTSNKPFLPVRVNGSDPLWFILDTGSSGGCVIARNRALALGLTLEGERWGRAGAGEGARILIAAARGITFSTGEVKLVDQPASVVPLDHVSAYEGRWLDGTLGYNFISRFVVEIDYANKSIRLHDPNTYEYTGRGRIIPFKFMGGLVVVRARIKPPGGDAIEADLVVDTGMRTTLILNRPFVEKNSLVEAMPKLSAATIGGGVGGERKGLVGRFESLRLGPFLLNKPVVVLSQDRTGVLAGDAFAGIIGGQILRRCKVIFDYSRKRMILEPNARVPAPYEYDMSGLFLVAPAPDFKRFTVQSVMKDSPAAEAGLRKGDVITAIDGRPAAEFTLERVRRLFMQEGRECVLDIKRGDERLRVTIKLRRVI